MPLYPKTRAIDAAPQLSPSEVTHLLSRARLLQHATRDGNTPLPLRGKNLGLLCETQPDEAQALFRSAAEELGARVAITHSGLSLASTAQEVQNTARMLGRLYEAVECQGLAPTLVECIGLHAGIPVFDGAAMKDHLIDHLAQLLDDSTSLEDNRRFVLQALLLEAIA
ncbi:ornithine carbamoyltransferase [Variovorax ginsengisoli]|uniref:Ornithine carbamoyltransferase n=1 Tax=Variovorax ginsengisoli TaxID=363844 RepID=A0ABT9S5S0_9BURK|nr:ornithine carbamoyltransferase [Variovorax ginsengisoli]MDP9898702.1 ornithine carbamoyltransferase [Variovorax ginsengisoli]